MSLELAAFSSPLWLWLSEQLRQADDMLLTKEGDLIPYPFSAFREFLCLVLARPCCKLIQLANLAQFFFFF